MYTLRRPVVYLYTDEWNMCIYMSRANIAVIVKYHMILSFEKKNIAMDSGLIKKYQLIP